MTSAETSLIAANVAFVGSHFALSHPFRAPLVRLAGEKGFLGLYSLVSLATFAWIVIAFRAVDPGGAQAWNGSGTAPWIVASVLTVLAAVLFIGSLRGNPAMPDTAINVVTAAKPTGAFAVTRHPMMWGFALWALAHLIAAPNARTGITAGAMGVFALLGAHLQDRKKEALLGGAWQGWEAQTSYWPRLGQLGRIGAGAWLGGLAFWLAATWLHSIWAGIPAGAFRWLG
jgi:uncharacterized membrane protein